MFQEAQRRIAAEPVTTAAMVRVLNHELRPSELFTPAFALAAIDELRRVARLPVRVPQVFW